MAAWFKPTLALPSANAGGAAAVPGLCYRAGCVAPAEDQQNLLVTGDALGSANWQKAHNCYLRCGKYFRVFPIGRLKSEQCL